jgi:AGZA family xanthine/uracil permease-like MFS transporter
MQAAGFALAGAVFTFFGFMHGEAIGVMQTPVVAVSYLIVAGIFAGCAKSATATSSTPEPVEEPAHHDDAEAVPAT